MSKSLAHPPPMTSPTRYESTRPLRGGRRLHSSSVPGCLALLLLLLLLLLTPRPALARNPSLTDRLLHHPSYKVRLQAAIYLAKLREPKTLRALVTCMKREPHYLVKAFCAAALGRIGNRTALPVLRKALRAENKFVRKRVKRAIELIEIQAPKGQRQGYPMQFKPRAHVFVLVEKPKHRPRRVSKRVQTFARRALRLSLNHLREVEVARPGVKVSKRWLHKRRLPALSVEVRVTRLRRRRRGQRVTVLTQVKAVITKYPSMAVAAIAEMESQSTQDLSGRVRRKALERTYRYLERKAVKSALDRVTKRLRQVPTR